MRKRVARRRKRSRRVAIKPRLNPRNIVAELKHGLEEKEAAVDHETHDRDSFRAHLTDLETAAKEIEQVVGRYQEARPSLASARKLLKEFLETKLKFLNQKLRKQDRKKVDTEIAKVETPLAEKRASLKTLENEMIQALKNYESVKKRTDESEQSMQQLMKLLESNSRILNRARELQARIGAEGQEHSAVDWFLVQELQRQLEDVELVSVAQLRTKLNVAWIRWEKDKEELREVTLERNHAVERFKRQQGQIERAITARSSLIEGALAEK